MSGVCGVSVGTGAVRIAYIADGRRVEDSIDAAGAHDLLPGKLVDHGPFEDIVLAGWDTAAVTALLDTLGDRTVPKARMVEESQALMAYARTVPELADKDYVLVVDLGKKGLSATALDVAGDYVEWTARTVDISGDRFDEVVRGIVMAKGILPPPVGPEGDEEYQAFFRELKELVSTSAGVRAPNRGPMLLSRKEFEREVTPLIADVLDWASKQAPDAVLLVGGGAAIPVVRSVIEDKWDVPVHVPDAPVMTVAAGAALDVSPQVDHLEALVVPDDASGLFDPQSTSSDAGVLDTSVVEGLVVDQFAAEDLAVDSTVFGSVDHAPIELDDIDARDAALVSPDLDEVFDAPMSDPELLDRTGFGIPSLDPGLHPSPRKVRTAVPRRGRVRWSVRDAALMVGALSVVSIVWGLIYTRSDTPPPPPIAASAIYDDPLLAPALPDAGSGLSTPVADPPVLGPIRLSDADLYEPSFTYAGELYQPDFGSETPE
ncbi:hypothetical protein O4220_05115 [Rhodococcus ruber]|uniref:DUF7159 domain-containing protein n=1 Tax=Rhodococcus ruber TaxID=1830 RepID=A0ABT4MA94_9NOCA|nr:hypothetical protein [Rhodococcus ruber]MCZ4517889.1 hypothetical protein [Rhodococcus ruber]